MGKFNTPTRAQVQDNTCLCQDYNTVIQVAQYDKIIGLCIIW